MEILNTPNPTYWSHAQDRASRMEAALRVMVLDPKISSWLEANDPKALEQALNALGIYTVPEHQRCRLEDM
jgi:hypothetical protein